ncbi:ammonium transporter family domain-containing protein [Ditylenchus destructor]|nr:ammonium transporter family domain-containing protein [Ditylenchus destructor]
MTTNIPATPIDLSLLAANLSMELQQIEEEFKKTKEDMADNNNAFFMCSMALIIFRTFIYQMLPFYVAKVYNLVMQCGFAFLEVGAVFAIISYWATGWALAHGPNAIASLDPYFGFSEFFLVGIHNYAKFFFQFVFAATAATIVSGAVAERCEFMCFITYSVLITSFTYPILTHWGWSPNGWMAAGYPSDTVKTTYIDFAGSGMVHLCGGTISLLAAYLMGPRIGRFSTDGVSKSIEIKGHSVPFAALGGFILMFGFLAFNGGSAAEISTPGIGQVVAKAMVNTIMCGAFAALTYLGIHYLRKGKWTVLLTINACLTGMVSACAGCNQMHSWASIITGIVAGLAYLAFSELCLAMKVDDPLDAFAVHFGGGLWGLISACLVTDKGLLFAFLTTEVKMSDALAQLGWQSICIVAIIVWSAVTLTPPFLILKAIGKFRVSKEVEIKGMDIFEHGEAAYPLTAYGHGWDDIEYVKDEPTNDALKSVTQKVDVSMDELANQHTNGIGPKYSLYQNPQEYEHPEHHHLAKNKNVFKRYHNNIAPA